MCGGVRLSGNRFRALIWPASTTSAPTASPHLGGLLSDSTSGRPALRQHMQWKHLLLVDTIVLLKASPSLRWTYKDALSQAHWYPHNNITMYFLSRCMSVCVIVHACRMVFVCVCTTYMCPCAVCVCVCVCLLPSTKRVFVCACVRVRCRWGESASVCPSSYSLP